MKVGKEIQNMAYSSIFKKLHKEINQRVAYHLSNQAISQMVVQGATQTYELIGDRTNAQMFENYDVG